MDIDPQHCDSAGLLKDLCTGCGGSVESWAMAWRRQVGLLYSLTGHLFQGKIFNSGISNHTGKGS